MAEMGQKSLNADVDAQIHAGRREKLRQSFKKYSLHTFNETQVLEFALGICIPRIDTNPLAHRLINTFGSLDGVISAHPDKLGEVSGVGNQTAFFLSFLKEFVTYHANAVKDNRKIKTPGDAIEVLRAVMKTYATEHFVMLCLDKTGAVILQHTVAGSLDKVDLNIRDIMDVVLRVRTASIVAAHNHVDGSVTPSDADIALTRALANVLSPLGINFMDHIIFGDKREYSFAREGLLDIFKREHKAYMASKDYEEIMVFAKPN